MGEEERKNILLAVFHMRMFFWRGLFLCRFKKKCTIHNVLRLNRRYDAEYLQMLPIIITFGDVERKASIIIKLNSLRIFSAHSTDSKEEKKRAYLKNIQNLLFVSSLVLWFLVCSEFYVFFFSLLPLTAPFHSHMCVVSVLCVPSWINFYPEKYFI